jgi:hypothetical protein
MVRSLDTRKKIDYFFETGVTGLMDFIVVQYSVTNKYVLSKNRFLNLFRNFVDLNKL